MTYQVLANGSLEIPVSEQFDLPMRGESIDGKDPSEMLETEVELPAFANQNTGILVRRTLIEVEPMEFVEAPDGSPRLRLRPIGDDARITMALPEA